MTAFRLTISILTVLVLRARADYLSDEPIPLSRCERNTPIYRIIPSTIIPSGQIVPLPHVPSQLWTQGLNRTPRQIPTALWNQLRMPQHTHHAGDVLNRAAFGRSGAFGLGGLRPTNTLPSLAQFGRPLFARTYSEPEGEAPCQSAGAQQIPAPPCPKNYLLSCGLSVAPVPCTAAKGGCY